MLDRSFLTAARPLRAIALALVACSLTAPSSAPAHAQEAWPDSAFMSSFRWRSIGPANIAGRVTDVEGIPGTPVFYVATAAGGIWKTTNAGVTFRPLFQNERVVAMGDLAIAPSDTSVVWAGTGEEDSRNSISPGAGVYKSTDGGLTWTLMGLEDTQAIGRIVVHPENSDIVYVAALGHIWNANEERGLYRTTDGGETWERIHHISERAGFVDLAMHPNDPDILFASSWERVRGPYFLRSGGPGSALWKSTDGGDTWTEVVGGGFPETEKGRIGIAIAHSDPDVMYAIVEAETPEDEEESVAAGGGEAGAEAGAEEAAEAEGGEAAGEEGEGEEGGEAEPEVDPTDGMRGSGLYRSEDGGETWTFMNDQNTRPFYYSQVRVAPDDPDYVVWSSTPVRYSKDGGETIGQTTLGIHVDQHAWWWDIANPDHIVAGNDGGIAITWDRGGNWWFPNTFPIGQFYAISYNMDVPYRVCGGLQDNGTWCGPSRRRQGGIDNHMWYTVNGGDGFWAPQDLENPDLMWAESQGGNIARIDTRNGTREGLAKPEWRSFTKELRDELVVLEEEAGESPTPGQAERMAELRERITADSASVDLRWNWNTPIVVSVHDPDVLYTGANRVLKSTERGDGLRPISPDLSYADEEKIRISSETTGGITPDVTGAEIYATIVALAESPLRAGWLYAGTDDGRVWMTRDDGESWTELTGRFPGVPEGTYVSRVEASHHDAERLYVTFDGHRTGDMNPYVYVTDDGGETFREITEGLPRGGIDFVHVVREDPHNENLLFVGTDVGVYISLDRGRWWRPFMEGFPTVPVHDLKIHPRDRELIAGTHGRSVWIVDIAPLTRLDGRGIGDEAILFDPTPGLQFGDRMIGGESTGQAWFSGESRRYGAEIAYYIPSELSSTLREEAREARDAAREDPEREEDASTRAQALFTILDAAGDTVQVISGSVTPGLKQVVWNFDPRTVEEPLSPSERRDSANSVMVVREIADSLVAAGADSSQVARTVDNYLSRPSLAGRARFAGASQSSAPEFDERPGENYPRQASRARARAREGGRSGFSSVNRDFFRAVRERGIGVDFRRSGEDAGIVDPGEYTVVMTLGERTWTTTLEVIREPGYVPEPR